MKDKTLPSVRELRNLYKKCRRLYFKYRIPEVKDVDIKFSGRLTKCAGMCYTIRNRINSDVRHKIRLSTHYHLKYFNEIQSTLIHEIIHLYIPGHGLDFRRELDRINNLLRLNEPKECLVTVHSLEPAVIKPRYYYKCSRCNSVHSKSRPYRELQLPYMKHRCSDGMLGDIAFYEKK